MNSDFDGNIGYIYYEEKDETWVCCICKAIHESKAHIITHLDRYHHLEQYEELVKS